MPLKLPKICWNPWILVVAAWAVGVIGLLATCSVKAQERLAPPDPHKAGQPKASAEAGAQAARLRGASRTSRERSSVLIAASQRLLSQLAEADRRERALWQAH